VEEVFRPQPLTPQRILIWIGTLVAAAGLGGVIVWALAVRQDDPGAVRGAAPIPAPARQLDAAPAAPNQLSGGSAPGPAVDSRPGPEARARVLAIDAGPPGAAAAAAKPEAASPDAAAPPPQLEQPPHRVEPVVGSSSRHRAEQGAKARARARARARAHARARRRGRGHRRPAATGKPGKPTAPVTKKKQGVFQKTVDPFAE
jgi:hypothetical protein